MRAAAVDPMEKLVADALRAAGIRFVEENETPERLDFYLPDFDVFIEVKQFHSDRIGEQMSRAPNVIAAQGAAAVGLLAKLIETNVQPRALI